MNKIPVVKPSALGLRKLIMIFLPITSLLSGLFGSSQPKAQRLLE